MRLLYAFSVILLSTLVGTAGGDLISFLLPASDSGLYNLLTTSIVRGVSLPMVDLGAFSFGFEFRIKLTIVSLMGMLMGTLAALREIRRN
ncbi:MAG: hypothetical protein NC823_01060 [Candidatus Omnitrophica bacterium]|nr:hypothetical protein [Candidatus Omnitrophota bacterium]